MGAPFTVVPRTSRELTREPTDTLETAFNDAITEFVQLKHQLGIVKGALRTAIEHLQEGAEQTDRETMAAVMAINMQCIAEQLQQLERLVGGSQGWHTQLEVVGREITNLANAHQLHGPADSVCALPAASIERVRSLLLPRSQTGDETRRVWAGQWA